MMKCLYKPEWGRIAGAVFLILTLAILWGCDEDGGSDPIGLHIADFGYHPVFSPDGSMIAFADTITIGVWLYKLSGKLEMLFEGGHNGDFVWSHQSGMLAYSVSGGLEKGLWTIDLEGNSAQLLDYGRNPSWSPDGSEIVFQTEDYTSGTAGISTIASDGSGAPVNILSLGLCPKWSPDGAHIGYLTLMGDSYNFHTYSVNTGATETVTQTGLKFNWSPDGQSIVFERYELTGSGSNQYYSPNIKIVDITGFNIPDLIWPGGSTPVWSPDGSLIAFENSSGDAAAGILTITPSGGSAEMITDNGFEPSISSSEGKIAFWRSDGIWVVDL